MWTEEDEEKYKDMAFVEIMTRGKRSVMGKLPDRFYVREKRMPFKYCRLFKDTLGVFLPEKEGDAPHIGSMLYYPEDMGEYVECVTEDNKYFITVEYQGYKPDIDLDMHVEEICLVLNGRNDDIKIKKESHYWHNETEVVLLFATISIEQDYDCTLFVINKHGHIYRFWEACETHDYEAMKNMAHEIVENIDIFV